MKWLFAIVIVVIAIVAGFIIKNKFIPIQQQEQATVTENIPQQMDTTTYQITPISHATMVLKLDGKIIYTDPVGGKEAFGVSPAPNIILVTDIHGDHFDADTLKAVSTNSTIIVMPQAVSDMLPGDILGEKVIMKNGETSIKNGITITAIPMYNVPESATAAHTKGRGNGYVIEGAGKRIYIAGDTDGTPEMKALQNIDEAFVPMNPPYTMSVENAAEAVIAFRPKVVHPYHYRTPTGLSDINKFKELVNAGDPNIKAELLNFYPEK